MKYLLDTHAMIGFFENDKQLPEKIRSVISDGNNIIYASIASIWEIAIKIGLGKLELTLTTDMIFEQIEKDDFILLAITNEPINIIQTLPHHHRDPFDRMIIAQAQAENCTIISRDGAFEDYDVPVLW